METLADSPFFAGAAAPILAVLCYAVSWLMTRLGVAMALRAYRRAAGEPWPERARLAFRARSLVNLNALLLPLSLGVLIYARLAPWLEGGRNAWSALGGFASIMGVVAVGQRLERMLCRPSDAARPAGVGVRWLLVVSRLAPFLVTFALIPNRWGWRAGGVLALGCALTAFNVSGGLIRLCCLLGRARPASERIRTIVYKVADRTGIRPRRVFELDAPQANALAFPVPQWLVYTSALLPVLDDDELAAVTAHELGHLREPLPVYCGRVFGAFLPVICAAGIPLGGSFGLGAALAPAALLVVSVLVLRRVARRMEVRADRLGAGTGEHTGRTYAGALEKIYEANLMPAVMPGRRQVHPHLYDRLIAAGYTPSYPRPAAPKGSRFAVLTTLALLYLCLALSLSDPGAEHRARRARIQRLLRASRADFLELERRRRPPSPPPAVPADGRRQRETAGGDGEPR